MTDKPLPPFSGDIAPCAKCGNEDAYTHYRAAGEPRPGEVAWNPPERLERECSRCGYRWDEACVPSGKTAS